MKTAEEIKPKIREFLQPILKGSVLEDDEDIYELGLVHSLFAMQIILFIEKNFNIELEPDEMELSELSSVNAIAAIVSRNLAEKTQ